MTPPASSALVDLAPTAPIVTAPGRPPSIAYPLASRSGHPQPTIVRVGNATVGNAEIGGNRVIVIAGPCAIESHEQLADTARAVRAAGATIIRGGAYKPRTSPYDFQGLGEKGLELLAAVGREVGLPVVTEVTDTEDVELVARYSDMLQIGSRNMSAFRLLQRAAATGKPILLKRGYAASIREWLLSAEYILAEGNGQVVLCERGIRTNDSEYTRNTLDLNAVPLLAHETHLPVIVDPSHGTGRADLVATMARGAIAVGACGLIVEVHRRPAEALCDGKQTLSTAEFAAMMAEIRPIASLLGRAL